MPNQDKPTMIQKRRARMALHKAIERGQMMKRPSRCECCGSSGYIIEAHHDSYEPDRHLAVAFLCQPCHRYIHEQRYPDHQARKHL